MPHLDAPYAPQPPGIALVHGHGRRVAGFQDRACAADVALARLVHVGHQARQR